MIPQLTWAMLRTVDFQGDPHKAVKDVNELIQAVALSKEGKCPHRPAHLVVTARGDFADRAQGSFCLFCSEEIEIEKIVWKTKSPLPNRPGL